MMNSTPDSGGDQDRTGDRQSFRVRRRHQKSRRGCLECKRRHMKCDETRPRCLNCATVDRTCSYNDKGGGTDAVSRASSSGTEKLRVHVDGDSSRRSSRSRSPSAQGGPVALPTQPASGYTNIPGHQQQAQPVLPTHPHHHQHLTPSAPLDDESHVNMVHLQLFHHFVSSPYGYFQPEQANSRIVKEITVKHAVTSPFLMHQLLAFAARHRSSISSSTSSPNDPEAVYYRHLATQLQAKAISLFGAVDLSRVSAAERVSIFLFSSLLGFHDLSETLSLRPRRWEDFMERYLQYVHLHRGLHKVVRGSWEMLRESELRPVLDTGEVMFRAAGTGSECDDLKARIGRCDGLGEEDKEACGRAIGYLQWGFDARPVVRSRANVLLDWVPMYPEGFMWLLEEGRKEALCVMGYYFVLLHYIKDVWFVYGSGEYLLGLLAEYLGSEWEEWMATPKELLKEGRG